jgi:hypothetical protein
VGLDLVAEEDRRRVVVARPTDVVRLDLDDLVDDADGVVPLLTLRVDVEERVQQRVVGRPELEGVLVGLRRLAPVVELLGVEPADLLVDLDLAVLTPGGR